MRLVVSAGEASKLLCIFEKTLYKLSVNGDLPILGELDHCM
jgi:hypothetical protein